MILQCEECNTRFKLDDSKIKEGGVKVRCSKCKHVFFVNKETSQDEPDFDSVLSSLGSSGADGQESEMATEDAAAGGGQLPGLESAGFETSDLATGTSAADAFPGFTDDLDLDKDLGPASPAPEEDGFDFNEFSFEDDTAEIKEPGRNDSASPSMDLNTEGFDFSAMDIPDVKDDSPSEQSEVIAESPGEFSFDFGSDDFTEPAENKSAVGNSSLSGDDTGLDMPMSSSAYQEPESFSFSMEEEDEAVAPVSSADWQDVASLEVAPESKAAEPDTFDFGSLDFGPVEEAQPEQTGIGIATSAPPQPDLSATVVMPPPAKTIHNAVADIEPDELPPLPISSRRRGLSFFPVAAVSVAFVLILGVCGMGYYLIKSDPAASSKLGLGFMAKMFGIVVPEEGNIAIRNPSASFQVNKEAGEIFVVNGEAVNNFKKPRASIQVRVSVMDSKGTVLMKKVGYCGNALSSEQLASLPMPKIEERMNNQFGDSLSNLSVKPGKGIPFVIVFANVPKGAADYSVEVANSTVATQ